MKIWLGVAILGNFLLQASSRDEDPGPFGKPMVTVFYESLCPGCIEFLTGELYDTYFKIHGRFDIDLIPYGNIKQSGSRGNWTFQCQHGEEECAINKLQACGIAKSDVLLKGNDQHMKFIYCIEKNLSSDRNIDSLAAKCSSELNLPSEIVLKCAKGPEADEFLAMLGDKQRRSAKDYIGTPAVYLNYEPEQEDLLTAICKLLHEKPKACPEEF